MRLGDMQMGDTRLGAPEPEEIDLESISNEELHELLTELKETSKTWRRRTWVWRVISLILAVDVLRGILW